MKVPIFNTIFSNCNKKLITKKIDINSLNNLNFDQINLRRYPLIKLLNLLPLKHSLYETVIVSANDTLVEMFLKNEIKFIDIEKKLFEIIKKKEFTKYKLRSPKSIKDIMNLNKYVRLKIIENSI
jgi:1-deoxy-D-xylulose-5-phosphate reductoisomerase